MGDFGDSMDSAVSSVQPNMDKYVEFSNEKVNGSEVEHKTCYDEEGAITCTKSAIAE